MTRPGFMIIEALRQLFIKPATRKYPYVKSSPPPRFRGRILYHADLCVGCRLCVKDCPAEAVQINKLEDGRFEAVFDLDRCIFCAQCVESCNKQALEVSSEFELATTKKSELRVRFDPDGRRI